MIDLKIKLSADYRPQETPIPLDLMDDSRTLFDSRTKANFGYLDPTAIKIISVLRQDLDIQLFGHSSFNSQKEQSGAGMKLNQRARVVNLAPSLSLYVILYGNSALCERVGSFAAKCNLYLQHPWYCDRNVPYKNPHCLTPPNTRTVYTFDMYDLLDPDIVSESDTFCNPIDLFADSAEQETLLDAATPQALRTKLYKHQKQALTFMMQRESGWALSGHHKDIWKQEINTFGRVVYLNTISGQKQLKPPKEFRGGLLIDAPGLGKSLSIIALIASTTESQQRMQSGTVSSTTTLLVVPKTCKLTPFSLDSDISTNYKLVIQTWKEELER